MPALRKNRGRPPGRKYRETIPVWFTKEQAKGVADFAKRLGVSQNEAIRRLVQRSLEGSSAL